MHKKNKKKDERKEKILSDKTKQGGSTPGGLDFTTKTFNMVFILVSLEDVPLTRCLVKRYILVWPQNKGHGKSISCKTDVGTDLRRAYFKKIAFGFKAAKAAKKFAFLNKKQENMAHFYLELKAEVHFYLVLDWY